MFSPFRRVLFKTRPYSNGGAVAISDGRPSRALVNERPSGFISRTINQKICLLLWSKYVCMSVVRRLLSLLSPWSRHCIKNRCVLHLSS